MADDERIAAAEGGISQLLDRLEAIRSTKIELPGKSFGQELSETQMIIGEINGRFVANVEALVKAGRELVEAATEACHSIALFPPAEQGNTIPRRLKRLGHEVSKMVAALKAFEEG